jgi:hypothetical protein
MIERHQNPPDCGAAKFVVMAFPSHHGIGMALKEGPVAAVLFALATQRVLLFANNRKTRRHRSLRNKLAFVICPAKDMSCDFLPMSRCQVTDNELDNAPNIGRSWDCSAPKQPCPLIELAANTSQHRVVVLGRESGAGASSCWDGQCYGGRLPVSSRGLLLPAATVRGYYAAPIHDLMAASKLYILRMNEAMLNDVRARVEESLPPRFQADRAIGLPIRAGDKCSRESICPTFESYMRIIQNVMNTSQRSLHYVVLTSDSKEMVNAHHKYKLATKAPAGAPSAGRCVPLRFVTNARDVMQGHGDPQRYLPGQAREVMASSLSTLVLQLHARHVLINCCSSFHKLLGDVVRFASGRCSRSQRVEVSCAISGSVGRRTCAISGSARQRTHEKKASRSSPPLPPLRLCE